MGTPVRPQSAGRDDSTWHQVPHLVVRVARGFFRASGPDAAGGLTFYAVLAGFPAVIAAFSLVGMVGRKRDGVGDVLDAGLEVLPPDVISAISDPVQRAAATAGGGWVLIL